MGVEIGTGVNFDVGPALAALDKLGGARDTLAGEFAKSNAAISQSFAPIIQSIGDVASESRAAATAQRQFAGDIAGLVKEIRDQAAAQREAQQAGAAAAAERRKASQEAREAAKVEKAAAKEAAAAAKEVAAAERLRAKEAANAAKESEKAGGFFSNLISKITGAKSGGEFFSNLATNIGVAGAAVFAFNTIFSRIQQGLSDYSALRGVQKTLEAVAGSAQAGGDEFAYISQKSDELGLSLVPTAKAYAGLFAAAKEANISVATTRSVFEGVASAAKVLNLSAEDTNGVLLALQQIASKGTVASEELRGQIGERLPGAFGLAAKAVGLTTAELGKQLQAGKVLAADFLPKFAAQLKATYGDATADAAQQVGSNLGRINTFFAQSSARIGAGFAPLVALIAALVSPSKTLTQVAQEGASAYFRQAEAAKALTETVTPLLARYDELNGTTNRNATQQKELDSVIQQLAKSVPGAVTEFDKYGKALNINRDAVRKFIGDQQNLTQYLNKDALGKNSADLRRLLADQEFLQKAVNNTVTGPDGLKRREQSFGTGGVVSLMSQEESDKLTADYSAKLTKVQLDIQANLENRQRLRGYNPLLPTDPTPAQLEGLVKKQEDIIKALKVRQMAATQENQGGGADFLLGKGGLNDQLKEAQKELDRLLGKVDKTAKSAADKLAAALRALQAARAELTAKAAQAVIKDSDDAATRAKFNFDEALRNTALLEQKLIEREAAVRKAGGRGANADGVIDGVQEQQLTALRLAAMDKYYADLYAITKAREQRLFDLREGSNTKEVEAVNRKYDALLAAQHIGQAAEFAALDEAAGIVLDKARQRSQEEVAIEEARQRELLALKASQEQKRIDQTAALGTATAQAVGQQYGAGTGISVFEAKRAEQKALLEIEKKAAEDSLNNTLNKTGKEAEIERQALRAQLGRIKHQQDELAIQEKLSQFSIYKLILGENDNERTRAALDKVASTIVDSLAQITAAEEQAAANRVAVSNQVITELTGQLAAQIQLNQQGSASNIKGLLDQIEAEKQARREALDDQRKIAREKIVIETLSQASSITTAAAEVFATFAALGPFGVIAGIAAATLLVGSFVAAKAQAYAAAGNIGQGFRRGGFTGGSSPDEERGVVHGQEFVHTAEKTVRYRTLFDALHNDTPDIVNWELPQYRALLPKASDALLPDLELPNKLREERAQNLRVQHEHSFAPMQARFARMDERLAAIEKSNTRMADKPDRVPLGGSKYIEIEENGSTHVKDLG